MLDFVKEKKTVWQILKETKKPIAVYGMGDGADKIFNVFEKFDIKADAVFASDEFVRGHSFHGFLVEKLSQVKERLNDFVIVVSFATQREEVLERIFSLSQNFELYAPDVPVAGDGLFDLDFLCENEDKIKKVYDSLADEDSKKVFEDVINFKISGKVKYLAQNISTRGEIYSLLNLNSNEHFLDLGAYNGDTIKQFLDSCQNKYERITALEPDIRNYKKLDAFLKEIKNATAYNLGAHSNKDTLIFASRGGRNSSLFKNGKEVKVEVDSVDNLLKDNPPTVIKFDVEGNEKNAINGCENTIKKNAPRLLIAAYHRNEDIFSIPLQIIEFNENYKIYLRREAYIPAWEINFIFKEN